MIVQCPHCYVKYNVPDHIVGKKLRCKHCQKVIDTADAACLVDAAIPEQAAAGAEHSVPLVDSQDLHDASESEPEGEAAAAPAPVSAPASSPDTSANAEELEIGGNPQVKDIVPETHERIREDDIEETLENLADAANTCLPQFTAEHIDWIRAALHERQSLCSRQYLNDGRIDEVVNKRLKELDAQINGVSPEILKVLHFLSRIRAIIPALLNMQEEMKHPEPDPTAQMIKQMKYDCSKAEVQSAIRGLADLHIRPKILAQLEQEQASK